MTSQPLLQELSVSKPILGMLHLPALPGAPRFTGNLAELEARVLRDAETLVAGGVDGLVMENFHDTPFYPGRVPCSVVAHMTRLATLVSAQCGLPLGINVLRNDGLGALSVAHAAGAAFIRVNIFCGARVTDQGIINGEAHQIQRQRVALHAQDIRIFADVNVKHSAPLAAHQSLESEVRDTFERGHADAVIITGRSTGLQTDSEDVQRAKAAAGQRPVLVGSGVTAENAAQFRLHADGFIVGTSLKRDGQVDAPVDLERVKALVGRLR